MPDSQWLWMRPWTLAICSAAALLVPYVSTLWLPLILTTISLLLLGVSRCWKSLVPWRPLMLAVAIGCGWGLLQGFSALRAALPMPCEGRDLWLQGLVWDLPQRQPGSYPGSAPDISRWTFRVTAVADRDDEQCLWSGGLIRVYWDDLLPAEPGQHWQIRARLRRPVYPLNPGSSDREAAALHAGIRAIASASVQHARLVNDALSNRVWHQQMRWSLLQRIEASELPQWQRALIRALTIGDRSGLSDTVQDRVRALGLSHLLVVSGLHIGIVATWAWLGGSLLGRILNLARCGWPAQYVAALAALASSALYAALAGFAVPTQRALVAVAGASVLRLAGGAFSPWQLFFLGLLSVALIEPFAALSAGFWLSFAAVACILWLRQWQPALRGWQFVVAMQCLLCLGLAPLSSWWFGEFSWVAPWVNLIAVPLVSLWMVPLCLLAALASLLFDGVLDLALWRLAMLPLQVLETFGSEALLGRFFAVESQSWVVSPVLVTLMVLASLIIVLPVGQLRWCLVLVLALPAVLTPRSLDDGMARLTVLDVGQATAVVWQEPGYTLVYDVGGGNPAGANAAVSTLLPYLRLRGISRIDDLVISHADRDHVAGLAAVLDRVPVDRLYGEGLPVDHPEAACLAGHGWRSRGSVFQFLAPAPAQADSGSRNDRSCVLLIEHGNFRVLLPGDIGSARERELVRYWRESIRADWLLAAHHGSRSASGATWIKWVNPQHVVFSAGYRNRFGHPHPAVLQRFAAGGVQHYNTAEQGALEFTLQDGALRTVKSERERRARFWRF